MSSRHCAMHALACIAAGSASFALSGGALAQEATSPHSVVGNLGFVSNYVFRGMTYTQNRPALQGGFDYAHASGLYAGVWGTNVSNEAIHDASLEIDFYGGYAGAVGDWSYDVGLLQFYYPERPKLPGTREKYDTLEAYASVGWQMLTLKYSHTLTDFFGFNSDSMGAGRGDSKGSGYLELNAKVPVGADFTLGLHVGRQRVHNYGDFDYTDWRVALSKAFGAGWTVAIAYTDTNADDDLWVADDEKLGEGHWIASLTRSF